MEKDAAKNLAFAITVAIKLAKSQGDAIYYGDILKEITNLRVYGNHSIAFTYRGEEWSMTPGIMPVYTLS